MSKKPIIVFEGIEGSGKSYHLASVVRYFKQKKISFIKIREPGGSINSEKIRKLMLNKLTQGIIFCSWLEIVSSHYCWHSLQIV